MPFILVGIIFKALMPLRLKSQIFLDPVTIVIRKSLINNHNEYEYKNVQQASQGNQNDY